MVPRLKNVEFDQFLYEFDTDHGQIYRLSPKTTSHPASVPLDFGH
ncbi:hypothetical protein C7460_10587 [Marinoscillum furvescens DSM 4134]|uniref:Uncharacterized protein n=1 Tax=Marinoscillum furvescens DSM 4134 TaxID=1122208 RepID=A0A3D9L5D4_MARFU|nr:hypothetical protein C7460_10587 [Marinoscillum furvescens DSM 4134]